MKQIAIYPGTFDPITNGHLDLIKRAASLFEQVIVAIAPSSRKSPFISLPERLQLVSEAVRAHSNVSVTQLEGLLVEFARKHQARVILRGLRAVSDFDYEFQLAGMNRQLATEIETLFLPASESVSYISATMVREIVELGGDVSAFVPPAVVTYLKQRSVS